MKQVELGKTGIMISAIGLGGMPLSIDGRPPEAEAAKVIDAALGAGINFIDTADVYCIDDEDIGHNERLIAATLRGRDRDGIHVATKGGLRRPKGAWTRDGSPRHLRDACEKSLRALATEQIFLYQFHAPDPETPFEKSVETLARLKDEGKVQHVGLSNVSVAQIEAASQIVEVASVQNRLNPYFREAIEEGVVKECEQRGITFLAYSPVGGGRLAKKIPQFNILTKLARKHSASPHAVVLAWVRSQGPTVVPIPGATKIRNVLDSVGSAELVLPPEDMEAIDESSFSRE